MDWYQPLLRPWPWPWFIFNVRSSINGWYLLPQCPPTNLISVNKPYFGNTVVPKQKQGYVKRRKIGAHYIVYFLIFFFLCSVIYASQPCCNHIVNCHLAICILVVNLYNHAFLNTPNVFRFLSDFHIVRLNSRFAKFNSEHLCNLQLWDIRMSVCFV